MAPLDTEQRNDGAPASPLGVVGPLQTWACTELRDLPWRRTRDPWHVLVSEVMLQQTQVARVVERWHQFTSEFPTPASCAEAPVSRVIESWAGLGYNRRAVNLWKTAVVVTDQHGGMLPDDLASLLALPGVGPYTARAILAFAFEHDVAVLDTNVGRLLARWSGQPLSGKQAQIMADSLVPVHAGWSWNQTLFDFAVAVCTKRNPNCGECPVHKACVWKGSGEDPAVASAGVSGRQSSFEGSERQVRGRIVDALRRGPVLVTEVAAFGRPGDTAADVLRIAETLVADGLAERLQGSFALPS